MLDRKWQQRRSRLLGFFFGGSWVFQDLADDSHLLCLQSWAFIDLMKTHRNGEIWLVGLQLVECLGCLGDVRLLLGGVNHLVAVAGQWRRLVAV